MSSPWKTGLKEKAFNALPEIIDLARDVLSPDKLKEASNISQMLFGSIAIGGPTHKLGMS